MSNRRADLNLSDDSASFELRPAEGAALREALRAGLVPQDQVRALLLLCQEAARGGQRLDVLALLAERFTAPAQRPALAELLARLGPSVAGGERVPAPESVERARAAMARGEIPLTLTRLHDVAIPLPATGLGSRPAPEGDSDSREGLPARIGTYPLRRELGRGGMGVVYLADDPGLERPVAIKVCSGLSSLDPERRARRDARFRREAQAVARLRHPGIVSVHAFGQHDGVPYIVMDYVPGETLQAVGKRGVSPERAAAWVRDLADALEHAHSAGVLHRDVKPENVVVDLQGRVHLMDFGLAHDALRDTGLTNTGQLLGTAFYMSPEQAAGSEVDARTDVYSLGAVLYFLLARRPPYDGENWLTFLQSLQSSEPAPLRSLNPDVPAALQRVVERCLAKDREQRFPSAAALAAALASPSGASASAAPRSAGSPPLARIVAGVAAAGVALSLAFAVALRGGGEDASLDDPAAPREVAWERFAPLASGPDAELAAALEDALDAGGLAARRRGAGVLEPHHPTASRRQWEAVLARAPLDPEACWHLHRLEVTASGATHQATPGLSALLEGDARAQVEPFLRGLELERAGDLEGATVAYGEAVSRAPDAAWLAWFNLAERTAVPALEAGTAGELASFERHALAAREAGLPPPLQRRLEAWRQVLARDLTGALSTLEAAPALSGAWAHLARGWAHYYRDELPQAQRAGEAALAAEPQLYEGHYFMSMIHSRFGRGSNALAHLERMVQLRGTNTELVINRAAIRAGTGDLAGCIADCTEVLRLEPRNAVARLNLGKAHLGLGQAQEAIGHLDFLVDLLADLQGQLPGQAHWERAQARLALGDGHGALEDFRALVKKDPYGTLTVTAKAAIKELEEKLGGGTPSPDPPR